MQVNITICLNIQIILIAHKFFQCYPRIARKQNMLSIHFNRGIDMCGKEILDGKRSGYLYGHFPFPLGEVADQRKGLSIRSYRQWPDKGAYTLSEKGLGRMACWQHGKDQRGPMMRTNLRNARRTAGFSQGRLAAKVGVTQQALSKHERATSAPGHFSTIRQYEKALNVPAEYLFPDIFNS